MNHCGCSCRGNPTMMSRKLSTALLFTLTLLALLHRISAIEWLAVIKRKDSQWNKTHECLPVEATPDGLTRQQRKICRRTIELMPVVVVAGQQTVQVCQNLFYDSRWNCSSILQAPHFMADLTGGSREQSIVYALAAASLGHSVAKACSSGVTSKCGCGPLPLDLPKSDFRWGGCSDNIRFGVWFSRVFSDSNRQKEGKQTKKTLMNVHNSRVGRKKITESLITTCKCHGVSGSCSVKTCWKGLPELRVIGSTLLNSYYVAVEVRKRLHASGKANGTILESTSMTKKSFTEDDLIYYNKSPDYCLPDSSLGSIGTHDRECIKDHIGSIGCRSMCCGRGFNSEMIERVLRCECKYYWCCYVKCKLCTSIVEINRCR